MTIKMKTKKKRDRQRGKSPTVASGSQVLGKQKPEWDLKEEYEDEAKNPGPPKKDSGRKDAGAINDADEEGDGKRRKVQDDEMQVTRRRIMQKSRPKKIGARSSEEPTGDNWNYGEEDEMIIAESGNGGEGSRERSIPAKPEGLVIKSSNLTGPSASKSTGLVIKSSNLTGPVATSVIKLSNLTGEGDADKSAV